MPQMFHKNYKWTMYIDIKIKKKMGTSAGEKDKESKGLLHKCKLKIIMTLC